VILALNAYKCTNLKCSDYRTHAAVYVSYITIAGVVLAEERIGGESGRRSVSRARADGAVRGGRLRVVSE
jgi:hypothetical protein